jgi:hypothetical protein
VAGGAAAAAAVDGRRLHLLLKLITGNTSAISSSRQGSGGPSHGAAQPLALVLQRLVQPHGSQVIRLGTLAAHMHTMQAQGDVS